MGAAHVSRGGRDAPRRAARARRALGRRRRDVDRRRQVTVRRAVLVATLLALAAGARADEKGDLTALVEGLSDANRRAACYRELSRRRDPRAVTLLIAALPRSDAWTHPLPGCS